MCAQRSSRPSLASRLVRGKAKVTAEVFMGVRIANMGLAVKLFCQLVADEAIGHAANPTVLSFGNACANSRCTPKALGPRVRGG